MNDAQMYEFLGLARVVHAQVGEYPQTLLENLDVEGRNLGGIADQVDLVCRVVEYRNVQIAAHNHCYLLLEGVVAETPSHCSQHRIHFFRL